MKLKLFDSIEKVINKIGRHKIFSFFGRLWESQRNVPSNKYLLPTVLAQPNELITHFMILKQTG